MLFGQFMLVFLRIPLVGQIWVFDLILLCFIEHASGWSTEFENSEKLPGGGHQWFERVFSHEAGGSCLVEG